MDIIDIEGEYYMGATLLIRGVDNIRGYIKEQEEGGGGVTYEEEGTGTAPVVVAVAAGRCDGTESR